MRSHRLKVIAPVALVSLAFTLNAAAETLLVDRGLPSINLNNAAGANRSNVTWAADTPTGFTGDDFMVGTTGQQYVINSITVWGAQYNPLSLDISNIWLYLGKSGSPLTMVSTGAVTGNTNSNPNITHTYVSYPDLAATSLYEGGANSFPICKTTFSGLNYLIDGGVKYNFGVNGDDYLWWNHASNAALSGTPQDGADDLYLTFDTADLSVATVTTSYNNGWDKASDINVQVTGTQIPEPASLMLLGLGALAIVARRRNA